MREWMYVCVCCMWWGWGATVMVLRVGRFQRWICRVVVLSPATANAGVHSVRPPSRGLVGPTAHAVSSDVAEM